MSVKPFVDTNIWIYAHLDQNKDPKGVIANNLVETAPQLVVSTQVLSEYYSVMLRNRAEDAWIQSNLEAISQYCEVIPVSLSTIRGAHRIRLRYHFSYWDSLIIASALEAGATLLYSEDMQSGQLVEDVLLITNPFI